MISKRPSIDDIDWDEPREIKKQFPAEAYRSASKYRGRRATLRRKVEINPKKLEVLECLTQLMVENSRYQGFLWKLTHVNQKSGEKNHFYFLGAAHYSLTNDVPVSEFFHPKVLKAFHKCKNLYVELLIDTLASSDIEKIQRIMKKVEKSDRKNYTLFLSEFIEKLYYQNITEIGLDTALLVLARQKDYKRHSLENKETQIDSLRLVLKTKKIKREVEMHPLELTLDLLNATQHGNIDQIQELYEEEWGGDACAEFKNHGVQRNIEMAKSIREVIEIGKDAFFAIGAMHLIGPNNILSLLEEYSIVRVL